MQVYQLNSFTHENLGGNPAGVVLNADNLTDIEMQNTAAMVGFSETAFVSQDKECDFHVRFFTPKTEVDFCGHATLATFSLMFQKGLIQAKTYIQRTKAGKLAVQINGNGFVEMDQALPSFLGTIAKHEIADSLNIAEETLYCDNLPIEIVSTGLADIIVPINTGYLDEIIPNFEKIEAVSKKYNAIGYHLFELPADNPESDSKFSASCRNFAPVVDIDEESATGSAAGALACYFFKHSILPTQYFEFEQGKTMGCRSSLQCAIETEGLSICAVKVGGFAKLIKKINTCRNACSKPRT